MYVYKPSLSQASAEDVQAAFDNNSIGAAIDSLDALIDNQDNDTYEILQESYNGANQSIIDLIRDMRILYAEIRAQTLDAVKPDEDTPSDIEEHGTYNKAGTGCK